MQSTSATLNRMKFTGLHHITMITGDAQEIARFYGDLLGLRVCQEDGQLRPAAGLSPLLRGRDRPLPGRSSRGSSSLERRVVAPARGRSTRFSSRWPTRPRSTSGSSVSKIETTREPGVLRFADYDGLRLELVVSDLGNAPLVANHPDVPVDYAITGPSRCARPRGLPAASRTRSSPTCSASRTRAAASTCSTAPDREVQVRVRRTTRAPTTGRAPAACTTSPGPRRRGPSALAGAHRRGRRLRDRRARPRLLRVDLLPHPEWGPVRDRDALSRASPSTRTPSTWARRFGCPGSTSTCAPQLEATLRPVNNPRVPGMSLDLRGARARPRRRACWSSTTAAAPTSTTCSASPTSWTRSGGCTSSRPAARCRSRAGRAALVRRAARRVPGSRHLPGRATRPPPASTTRRGSDRHHAGEHGARRLTMGSVMSYSLGLGPDRPAPAGIMAFSGFIPTVDGWQPDLRARHARVHRARPPRPGHGRPVRTHGQRAADRGGLDVTYLESDAAHHIDPAHVPPRRSGCVPRSIARPPARLADAPLLLAGAAVLLMSTAAQAEGTKVTWPQQRSFAPGETISVKMTSKSGSAQRWCARARAARSCAPSPAARWLPAPSSEGASAGRYSLRVGARARKITVTCPPRSRPARCRRSRIAAPECARPTGDRADWARGHRRVRRRKRCRSRSSTPARAASRSRVGYAFERPQDGAWSRAVEPDVHHASVLLGPGESTPSRQLSRPTSPPGPTVIDASSSQRGSTLPRSSTSFRRTATFGNPRSRGCRSMVTPRHRAQPRGQAGSTAALGQLERGWASPSAPCAFDRSSRADVPSSSATASRSAAGLRQLFEHAQRASHDHAAPLRRASATSSAARRDAAA